MARGRKLKLTKRRIRTALTVGERALAEVDGRSTQMRRLRDYQYAQTSSLGGEDNISHAERMLISRASMLGLLCETLEAQYLSSGALPQTELDNYFRNVGVLTRVLLALGLERRARPVQSLNEYIAEKYDKNPKEAEDEAPR